MGTNNDQTYFNCIFKPFRIFAIYNRKLRHDVVTCIFMMNVMILDFSDTSFESTMEVQSNISRNVKK